ncbi:MAG: histidine kinase, partial [Bacteroidota bacterium]
MTTNLPRLPESTAGRVGVLAAFWVGLTLFMLVHAYLMIHVAIGREYRPEYAVSGATQGLVWIALTPLVVALVRRFPLLGRRWIVNTGIHFAIAAAVALLVALLVIGTVGLFDFPPVVGPDGQVQEAPRFLEELEVTYARVFLLFMLLWFGVVAAATAMEATRVALAERERAAVHEAELREREVRSARLRERAAQLESQLSAAQLDALRMQLNPHFLFNTLHAVSTLMARDVDGARRMITDLSDLLRRVLEDSDAPEVPLNDELD